MRSQSNRCRRRWRCLSHRVSTFHRLPRAFVEAYFDLAEPLNRFFQLRTDAPRIRLLRFGFLWTLALWAFPGGVITRRAIVQLATDAPPGIRLDRHVSPAADTCGICSPRSIRCSASCCSRRRSRLGWASLLSAVARLRRARWRDLPGSCRTRRPRRAVALRRAALRLAADVAHDQRRARRRSVRSLQPVVFLRLWQAAALFLLRRRRGRFRRAVLGRRLRSRRCSCRSSASGPCPGAAAARPSAEIRTASARLRRRWAMPIGRVDRTLWNDRHDADRRWSSP